mgnify:CR=1 FL=1
MEPTPSLLPASDPQRELLHNEVHARPPARIHLPALLTYVAVFNEGVDREQECALLRRLPGQAALTVDDLHGNFLRLRLPGYTLKWERHTEFTRYSIVQPLPENCGLGTREPDLPTHIATPPGWLAAIPGRTFAAIQLVMVHTDWPEPTPAGHAGLMAQVQRWLGRDSLVASQLGGGHSWALTDFALRADLRHVWGLSPSIGNVEYTFGVSWQFGGTRPYPACPASGGAGRCGDSAAEDADL